MRCFVGQVTCLILSVLLFAGCGSTTDDAQPAATKVVPQRAEKTPDDPPPNKTPNPTDEPAVDGDAQFRRLVVGTWEDDYKGKRTMTIREDGTATMVVELSGVQASLFASKLTFEMEWAGADGHLMKRTIRGEPAGRVNFILKTMGDRVNEPILELTEDRLLLLDADGETKYDWRRVR